jgi:hypothetical protein
MHILVRLYLIFSGIATIKNLWQLVFKTRLHVVKSSASEANSHQPDENLTNANLTVTKFFYIELSRFCGTL